MAAATLPRRRLIAITPQQLAAAGLNVKRLAVAAGVPYSRAWKSCSGAAYLDEQTYRRLVGALEKALENVAEERPAC